MARTQGAMNASSLGLRKSVRQILTDKDYEEVIRALIDIALNSKSHAARVAAIKLLIDRVEGPLPTIVTTEETRLTIADVLNREVKKDDDCGELDEE